jgi:hypothetical protein
VSRLLKEKPFSFRERGDGTVAVYWKRQLATTLTGKLAENLLAAAPEASEEELQLLLARATGNFKRGNERKQRR